MEAVKAFNDELASVNEFKGAISRAKMTRITGIAIKAVKFYKHVVHSVEKFIQKSDADHKIPGLYVMDAIIRQSIHRFGSDKDVFASRFAKNLSNTFKNLLLCKEDDKVKIVRVLQLWQRNSVFSMDLIQQLLDMIEKSSTEEANQSIETSSVDISMISSGSQSQSICDKTQENGAPNASGANSADSSQNEMMNTVIQLLQSQSDKALQINQLLQQVATKQPQLLPQLSQIIQLSQGQVDQNSSTTSPQPVPPVSTPSVSSSSNNMNSLLGGISGRFANTFVPSTGDSEQSGSNSHAHQSSCTPTARDWSSNLTNQGSDATDYSNYDYNSNQCMLNPPQNSTQNYHGSNDFIEREEGEMWDDEETGHQHGGYPMEYNNNNFHWDANRTDANFNRKRRRSTDRDSRERSRRSRSREKRRRSRSIERSYGSPSRERYEGRERRELEKNRRRLGLPLNKPNHVLICSTTLWIGHLNKHSTEHELRTELSNYGTVTSMNVIPPRGCAFVTFSTRKEAQKALDRTKGMKLLNSVLKVAWATGTGMKESVFKEFWDLEQGASFIPLEKINDNVDLDTLAVGGFLDEESLSEELLKLLTARRQRTNQEDANSNTVKDNSSSDVPVTIAAETRPQLPSSTAAQCFPPMPPMPLMPVMPPILPPPPGMLVGIPPPIIPPGGHLSAMLSPNQGTPVDQTTPTSSSGAPGQLLPEINAPFPPFPPPIPPMAAWGAPGMRPPPMPFPPPPPMPLRHMPPRGPVPNFHPESNMEGNKGFEPENPTGFPPNFPHPRAPFRAPLGPPPAGRPGPWSFNARGGPRGPPPPQRNHYPPSMGEDEYYGEGNDGFPHEAEGNSFPPNRHGNFNPNNPRFGLGQDHHFRGRDKRGRNNWGKNNPFRNDRGQWGPNNDGDTFGYQGGEDGEYQEEFHQENEGYYEENQHDEWRGNSIEHCNDPQKYAFQNRGGWNKRGHGGNRWPRNDEQGYTFQRGSNKWHNSRGRGFQKWHKNQNQSWGNYNSREGDPVHAEPVEDWSGENRGEDTHNDGNKSFRNKRHRESSSSSRWSEGNESNNEKVKRVDASFTENDTEDGSTSADKLPSGASNEKVEKVRKSRWSSVERIEPPADVNTCSEDIETGV